MKVNVVSLTNYNTYNNPPKKRLQLGLKTPDYSPSFGKKSSPKLENLLVRWISLFSAGIISLSALASHSSKITYVKDTNIAGRVYNYFEPEKLDSLAKVCERNPKKFLYEAHDNINTIVKNKRFDYVLSDNDAYWYLIDKKCNVVTKINSITNKEEGMVLHTAHGNLWQDENAKANLEQYVQTLVLPPENFLDIFGPPKCILRQR